MSQRKNVFRPDDRAVVVTPRFVKRVGYPKTLMDYEVVISQDQEAQTALGDLFRATLHGGFTMSPAYEKVRARVERELAYLLAQQDGWGGKERTIHWDERPELQDAQAMVRKVKNAYTGTYVSPTRWSSWSEDADDDPGYLDHIRCHRLAQVQVFSGERLWIPTSHLKKDGS